MPLPSDITSIPKHRNAVAEVAARVRAFYNSKTPFRIYHGTTNSTRQSLRSHDNIIDISQMNNVLSIDAESMTAWVEPNVPMDHLVRETLKVGLMPPVVMEFPGITAGGGFAGTSGESSSFRHGLFDRTVRSIEVVLGNGEVTTASPHGDAESAELYHAAAASFGTFGVVTLLALELVEAKPFVELKYIRIAGVEEAIENFESNTSKVDYMDGMLFAKDKGVVCLGKLANSVPEGQTAVTFSQPWDDWFYINAETKLETQLSWTEYIPVEDYLFRYERGAFWISKYTYKYFSVPLTRFTRWLLDTYTHTRIMYSALHHSGLSSQYVIQDVAIPYSNAGEFVLHLDITFRKYPLWLCPLKLRGRSNSAAHGLLADFDASANTKSENELDMMLNFGVWGPGDFTNPADIVTWNRAFEAKIQALGGQKWLYAHTYYTQEEFWTAYGDREKYDRLRTKYHASTLPSIYDKVKARGTTQVGTDDWWLWFCAAFWSIWPLAGLYGWILCIVSKEYLLRQKGSK